MPKAIAFPIDSRLYYKSIQSIVRTAKEYEINLRQTYKKLSAKALRMRSRYAHARQMKRAAREEKRLHTYLGRVIRDFKRKTQNIKLDPECVLLLETVERIFHQKRGDSPKVYSVHEPHVECIAKGKAHKKYEFGCKASLVVTHKEGLALDLQAVHHNPYDGHTLEAALSRAEQITHSVIEESYVDKGYRGHSVEGKKVLISGQKKSLTRWMRGQLKRRQAIEPHIGHMKNDGKLGRNYLSGPFGDIFNAILCGIGHNLRLIYNWLFPRRSRRRCSS